MSEPYLSQIMMFGGNFAPRQYALCNGQLLAISQSQALFSLLGTVYGGNGINTFALPDLRSNLPLGFGQGAGLTDYALGEVGGSPTVTLTQQTVPSHGHGFMAATSASATTSSYIQNTTVPGTPSAGATPALYADPAVPPQKPLVPHPMASTAVQAQGRGLPHDNLMPSLCISFVIALQGVFPSRN